MTCTPSSRVRQSGGNAQEPERVKTADLLERYVDLTVATGGGLVHGECNAIKIEPHHWPCRVPEHKNGDFASRQILLIPDSFVGGEQEVESVSLS